MIDLEDLYFEWLLGRLDPDGVTDGVAYLSGLIHNCEFQRRVGNDENRAVDGRNLRKEFLMDFSDANFDPHVTNELAMKECSWFEMLVALSRSLDYLYDGTVEGRYLELMDNVQLLPIISEIPYRTPTRERREQRLVDITLADIDGNRFEHNGFGGLFPLHGAGHLDQRKVEIWDQAGAYFNERF